MLNRTLDGVEVEYVLFHLSNHLVGLEQLREKMSYGDDCGTTIFFPASSSALSLSDIVFVDDIPVLFPLSGSSKPYTFIDGRLVFQHDLLKSAFFLLSGYQEWANPDKVDHWNRFDYNSSVQFQLGVIQRPLVNYYFQWIIEGLLQFAAFHNLSLERRKPFGRMALHLSHDIDLVRYHSFRKVAYRVLQLLYLRKRNYSGMTTVKSIVSSIRYLFKAEGVDNPYWSFAKILNTEKYFGFKSSWYFLCSDGGPNDADYSWDEQDVKDMIVTLSRLNQEVGLHGSIRGSEDFEVLKYSFNKLSDIIQNKEFGCRMHYLCVRNPSTLLMLDSIGLLYDCSLGFSKAEGFRNGYCFPFRIFDHEKHRMLDMWEIPLMAMDATMFGHNKRSYDDVFGLMEVLLEEVSKFNGVFSLLWHNSMFDEFEYPGILKFYEDLHLYLSQYNPNGLTGKEIIGRITSI